MPNWPHLLLNLLYHLALALWIGGTLVLGALVAPQLFRALPRAQAGSIFGPVLRRFARLRLGALVIAITAAALKLVLFEKTPGPWVAIRWAALAVMACSLVYEVVWLEKRLEARRVHLEPGMADDHPERVAFNRLHRRAETSLKVATAAAVVALLLS